MFLHHQRMVPRHQPETIWAVRNVPFACLRVTFYSFESVKLWLEDPTWGVQWADRDILIERARTHFVEYPGALTLARMSELEKQQADEYDLRMHGRDRVIFSWRRLPGVLD